MEETTRITSPVIPQTTITAAITEALAVVTSAEEIQVVETLVGATVVVAEATKLLPIK